MDGVGVTEQVVQVAEDLLVRADEKHAEEVVRSVELVQRQRPLDVSTVDELIDATVGITGDVLQNDAVRGPLVHPVKRDDGKKLLDGPTVGKALEQGEVAEVVVREGVAEPRQFLGDVVELFDVPGNLSGGHPVEVFCGGALLERHVPEAEQAQRLVERLLGVMQALDQIPAVDSVERSLKVQQRLGVVIPDAETLPDQARRGDADHVEREDAVVGRDRPAALGEHHRVRDFGFIADRSDVVDDVVGVFLERVVHARAEVGLGTIVVDAQPSADIDGAELRSELHELSIDARAFGNSRLDVADVRDLAPHVKVEQGQTLGHVSRLQLLEQADDFRGRQAKLRTEASGRLPASRPSCGQFDPNADRRPDPELFGVLEDQLQLGILFDDDRDVSADLLGGQRNLDEFVVFETVTDDGSVIVRDGHHDQQFRLRSGFQAESQAATVFEHLLDNVTLLVHFDRVQTRVVRAVIVFANGGSERRVNLLHPVPDDVVEPDEDGQADVHRFQPLDEFLEVHLPVGALAGLDGDVAVRLEGDVSLTPMSDIVQFLGVLERP